MTERRKVSTWQIVAMTAIGAVGTLVLLAFADTRDQLNKKVDKEVFELVQQDIKDIKGMMRTHIQETGAGKVSARR